MHRSISPSALQCTRLTLKVPCKRALQATRHHNIWNPRRGDMKDISSLSGAHASWCHMVLSRSPSARLRSQHSKKLEPHAALGWIWDRAKAQDWQRVQRRSTAGSEQVDRGHLLTWTKSLKSACRPSLAMPHPVSVTSNTSQPSGAEVLESWDTFAWTSCLHVHHSPVSHRHQMFQNFNATSQRLVAHMIPHRCP